MGLLVKVFAEGDFGGVCSSMYAVFFDDIIVAQTMIYVHMGVYNHQQVYAFLCDKSVKLLLFDLCGHSGIYDYAIFGVGVVYYISVLRKRIEGESFESKHDIICNLNRTLNNVLFLFGAILLP